jgi:hypothetical protein
LATYSAPSTKVSPTLVSLEFVKRGPVLAQGFFVLSYEKQAEFSLRKDKNIRTGLKTVQKPCNIMVAV